MDDEEVSLEEGGVRKPVDRYWAEMMGPRTAMGELHFHTLTQVMVAVLSLPHSNADCERSFSVVRQVHTPSVDRAWRQTAAVFPVVRDGRDGGVGEACHPRVQHE